MPRRARGEFSSDGAAILPDEDVHDVAARLARERRRPIVGWEGEEWPEHDRGSSLK